VPTHILYEPTDGVGRITLNRADVLNSFNARMASEVQETLDEIASNAAIRAVLLTGAGRAFCAGQDLSDVIPKDGPSPRDLGDVVGRQYNPIIRAIRTLEKPVVCAVNGVAAGAGANIAFACDIIVAADSASFIQSFSKIGLIPDSGGTFLLPRLVGMARATALAMLGDRLPASTALEWGMIYQVCPAAELNDVATALAQRLAKMPTRGLGLTKRGFNHSLSATLEEQLDFEEHLQREAGNTADYAEGVRAFLEKRQPEFTGR
jgi:2-(1,2-epoxy-1,2-dihydrophenyl)acetyl-CoA isomerase